MGRSLPWACPRAFVCPGSLPLWPPFCCGHEGQKGQRRSQQALSECFRSLELRAWAVGHVAGGVWPQGAGSQGRGRGARGRGDLQVGTASNLYTWTAVVGDGQGETPYPLPLFFPLDLDSVLQRAP